MLCEHIPWARAKESFLVKKLYFLNYDCRFDYKGLVPMLENAGLGKDTAKYWNLKDGKLSMNLIVEKEKKEVIWV